MDRKAERTRHTDTRLAAADKSAAQSDQSTATTDQASADMDQRASDRDQVTADRQEAANPTPTAAEEDAYDTSRRQRRDASSVRAGNRLKRSNTAHDRDVTGVFRDWNAQERDASEPEDEAVDESRDQTSRRSGGPEAR